MKDNLDKHPVFLLTFSDLLGLMRRNKRRILLCGLAAGVAAFLYAVMQPIWYEAEATFKDKGKSQAGLTKSISELFFLATESSESDALMMMKARKLYELLVQQQGLQAEIVKKTGHYSFLALLARLKNNLLVEYALFKHLPEPILADSEPEIQVENVWYAGEVPLRFTLAVTSEETYALFDQNGQKVAEGAFGAPLRAEALALTLAKVKGGPLHGNEYLLTMHPLGKMAERVAKKFKIEPDRQDKSFLKISYRYTQRQAAAAHLDSLMTVYQDYLEQEHERMAALQVAYLEQRQREMGARLEHVMSAHAEGLSSDLSSTGFSDSEKALEYLATAQQGIKQRLLSIALELKRDPLERPEKGADVHWTTASRLFSNGNELANNLVREIRLLRQERDEIRSIQETKERAAEEMAGAAAALNEFQGMNLKSAKELYLSYSQELSQLESQALQLEFIIQEVHSPNFEISSLGTLLSDAISIEMISKASSLAHALKDSENRSLKDLERLQADLELQRNSLLDHLNQTLSLLKIRQELLKTKLRSLQGVILLRLEELIAILESQLTDYHDQNVELLKQEKALLEESLAELRGEMSALPQKWTAEMTIKKQMELNRNMIEEISKLVESKNISNNLELIQSAPVDHPLIPIHPVAPHLMLITLLGTVGGMLLAFIWSVGHSIKHGVQASRENLQIAGFHVSGALSMHPQQVPSTQLLRDADLETLRRALSFFASPSKTASEAVLYLKNSGPNYIWALAELLFKRGVKVLVLDLCLREVCGPSSGLLSFLSGGSLSWAAVDTSIEKKEGIHRLHAGGITRFAAELFASERFKVLLEQLQGHYDWVLAYSDAPLNSAEAETLLNVFASVAVVLADETLEELQPYFNCGKQITFLLLDLLRNF